jgi:hypothetical protein
LAKWPVFPQLWHSFPCAGQDCTPFLWGNAPPQFRLVFFESCCFSVFCEKRPRRLFPYLFGYCMCCLFFFTEFTLFVLFSSRFTCSLVISNDYPNFKRSFKSICSRRAFFCSRAIHFNSIQNFIDTVSYHYIFLKIQEEK